MIISELSATGDGWQDILAWDAAQHDRSVAAPQTVEQLTNTVWRHYGASIFDPQHTYLGIGSVKVGVKPAWGLWASPIGFGYRWQDWCRDNDFQPFNMNSEAHFDFRLKPGTHILWVLATDDIETCGIYSARQFGFDWYLDVDLYTSQGWDGIYVAAGSNAGMDGLYGQLYGWDCDALCITNMGAIQAT